MCDDCGRTNKRGGRWCSACYQRRYRQRPEAYARHKARVAAYQRRNYRKWREWQYRWRERVGWRVPDLQALRAAINAVEAAVAQAEGRSRLRSSSQPGGNHDPQR